MGSGEVVCDTWHDPCLPLLGGINPSVAVTKAVLLRVPPCICVCVAHHTWRRERTNGTRLLGLRSLARTRARAQLERRCGPNKYTAPPFTWRKGDSGGDFCTLFTCRLSSPDSDARRSARCSLPQLWTQRPAPPGVIRHRTLPRSTRATTCNNSDAMSPDGLRR